MPVGCVFVKKIDEGGDDQLVVGDNDCSKINLTGRVLSAGFNATNASRNGTRHAELVAIDELLLRQGLDPVVFRGCELYVTCEVNNALCAFCFFSAWSCIIDDIYKPMIVGFYC